MLIARMLAAVALAWVLQSMLAGTAFAQSFPTKPVRIVVPYPPGGGVDILARALAADLTQSWGQAVVVENIPGAASIIGAEKVAAAPADGHTLLMTTNPTVVGNRFLYKKLPYDPDRDLAPVSLVMRSGQFVLAHPSLRANTLKELVEMAKRDPGKIAYSSWGNGTQPHLLFEAMSKREGIQLLHVPYKGIAPAVTAVVAGEVQLTVASPGQAGGLLKGGRLKALAIGDAVRARDFPSVPTSAEAGFPYALSSVWFGMFAPGGTPPALVERIARDVAAIARRPDFTDKQINSKGFERVASTPSEFAAAIRSEVVLIGEMVEAAGIQPE